MDIKVLASTHMGYKAKKEEFDTLSGKCAGVCYMPATFDDLLAEDESKTLKRVNQTKISGHHSVYDHNNISLYLDGIPKILAMVLNNEHQYTTSEKSARYTRMRMTEKEQMLYNKWMEIFKSRIIKKYQGDPSGYFTDSKIEKLAQENARYLISVFTPTSMVYTTTYRQLNYLITFMQKFIKKDNKSDFEIRLADAMTELISKLKELDYYDEKLCGNEKCRDLSIFTKGSPVEEYFGDVYAVNYKASFVAFAELMRHRTIYYTMTLNEKAYYIPPIIADNQDMVNLWLDDIRSLGNIYPQGTLLNVCEMGTLDNFILKLKERKCTVVQLEVNRSVNAVLGKYVKALQLKNHPRAEELMAYTNGSRCTFPDFKCTTPCGFRNGIDETRDI